MKVSRYELPRFISEVAFEQEKYFLKLDHKKINQRLF